MTNQIDQIAWSELNEDELKQLIEKANGELERLKAERFEQVQSQIKELSSSVGMTPEEIVMKMQRARRPGRSGGSPRSSKSQSGKTAAYVNPENPNETWSGRGKRPNWLVEKLDNGAKLEDFLA